MRLTPFIATLLLACWATFGTMNVAEAGVITSTIDGDAAPSFAAATETDVSAAAEPARRTSVAGTMSGTPVADASPNASPPIPPGTLTPIVFRPPTTAAARPVHRDGKLWLPPKFLSGVFRPPRA